MNVTRILLCEDHHVVRTAIAALLSREDDLEVVGEVADASGLIDAVEQLTPDVLVLDAHMPGRRVIDSARTLAKRHPTVRVLVLSAYDRREYVLGLLGAGALGYVLKDDPPETLITAVRAVAEGQRWLSPRIADVLVQSRAEPVGFEEELTARETEVLRLMALGHRNERIAETLQIGKQTVKNHVRSIFGKLGVENRVEAVLWAMRRKLVPGDETNPPTE